jgi:hypothetical protein
MSDSEKPRAGPDGTIELDRIESDASAQPAEGTEPAVRSTRKTPPPLPAFAQQPSVPPRPALSRPPPAPRSPVKTVAYIVLLVALIAVAIVAGRSVGGRSRAGQASAPAGSTAAATASGAAAAPSGSSDSVLMVPTIEMK